MLFLQGGASLQFSMVPLNLSLNGSPIDLINTGSWTKKALKEISKVSQVNVVGSTEDSNFLSLPNLDSIQYSDDAIYIYVQ